MAGVKIIGSSRVPIDMAGTVPNLWTVDFDSQRFGVRLQWQYGDIFTIADIWEIFVDDDGYESGTAELWEVTVGNAANVIRDAISAKLNDEIESWLAITS